MFGSVRTRADRRSLYHELGSVSGDVKRLPSGSSSACGSPARRLFPAPPPACPRHHGALCFACSYYHNIILSAECIARRSFMVDRGRVS